METHGERLVHLISKLKITPYQLSKELGYKRPDSIYTVINNSSKIGGKFISKLKQRYPTVNINWLVDGRGEMFKRKIRKGDYGCEILKNGVIIYPAKLSFEYLKRLAYNFSKRLWIYPEEMLFKMEARIVMTDGLEFKATTYGYDANRLFLNKMYSILVMPDWQVAGLFDFWRIEEESRRCQNLFKLTPDSINDFNNAIYESIEDLENGQQDNHFQVDPYFKDDNWHEILVSDPRINQKSKGKKTRQKIARHTDRRKMKPEKALAKI